MRRQGRCLDSGLFKLGFLSHTLPVPDEAAAAWGGVLSFLAHHPALQLLQRGPARFVGIRHGVDIDSVPCLPPHGYTADRQLQRAAAASSSMRMGVPGSALAGPGRSMHHHQHQQQQQQQQQERQQRLLMPTDEGMQHGTGQLLERSAAHEHSPDKAMTGDRHSRHGRDGDGLTGGSELRDLPDAAAARRSWQDRRRPRSTSAGRYPPPPEHLEQQQQQQQQQQRRPGGSSAGRIICC
ncbi:hypothetical protein OEZ85_005519 [Tetradesmus obliquus]|uniref:Uncharacterized protein n=1 Tax=Tetradesmus obliquus TaxID=3088 RepID=A0ABY8UIX7_TETOB|nr:hypothetical protein OEZ85_005519 [Tetradesmus obliquus]